MTEQEAIKKTNRVVEELKKEYAKDVIRDWHIPPLVNMKTGKTTGHGLEMQVSTKYDYNNRIIGDIAERLGADEWNIRVRRGQLWLRFFVHYDQTEKKED